MQNFEGKKSALWGIRIKKDGVTLTNVRLNALFVLLSGLCLIEVLSGKIVFADILEDKTVYEKKMAGENPVIPVK